MRILLVGDMGEKTTKISQYWKQAIFNILKNSIMGVNFSTNILHWNFDSKEYYTNSECKKRKLISTEALNHFNYDHVRRFLIRLFRNVKHSKHKNMMEGFPGRISATGCAKFHWA